MSGINGDSRTGNTAFETINAAASAIAAAENRAPHATVQVNLSQNIISFVAVDSEYVDLTLFGGFLKC